jgi:Fic family protein
MNQDVDVPPLTSAGLVHAQFETIHPFLDGNGRTGRLLVIFWLMSQGILHAPVLYPSLYLKKEQDEYVRRLQACRETSAWEHWLEFFLDAVAEAAEEACRVALAIVALRQEHEELISKSFGKRTPNALRLLRQLFATPLVNATHVERSLGVSQPVASALLNEFRSRGTLRETTGAARNRRYSYDAYLHVFPGFDQRS